MKSLIINVFAVFTNINAFELLMPYSLVCTDGGWFTTFETAHNISFVDDDLEGTAALPDNTIWQDTLNITSYIDRYWICVNKNHHIIADLNVFGESGVLDLTVKDGVNITIRCSYNDLKLQAVSEKNEYPQRCFSDKSVTRKKTMLGNFTWFQTPDYKRKGIYS